MVNVEMKSLLKRLDPFCIRCLEGAAGLCVSRTQYEVSVEHLLLRLAESTDGDLPLIFRHYAIDPSRVLGTLQRAVEGFRAGNTGKPVFSPLLLQWFQEGWLVASLEHNLPLVRSGALLAALVAAPHRYVGDDIATVLGAIRPEELRLNLPALVGGSVEDAQVSASSAAPGAPPAPGAREATALGRFTEDFTGKAKAGKIDPVFGRDREIRQMIDILARRRKNNPIVVGEAGVGKTAVVEGLALRIVQDDVPDLLKNVRLIGLDMGLLQAGAGVKGEFENRLKSVISEIKESPSPIVLFIDEAHTLIGAGAQAGGGDAANLLKPALARGELRTIAATTWSEYKKYFERDAALARRFQLVKLDEPSVESAVGMLRGLKDRYEKSHGIKIRDDAVVAAAELSGRYISGRLLPDKAVDVLDTSAARVKIGQTAKPAQVDDLERTLATLNRELGARRDDLAAGIAVDAGALKELEGRIAVLEQEKAELMGRWQKERDAVAKVLAARGVVPSAGLTEKEEAPQAASPGPAEQPTPPKEAAEAAVATAPAAAAPAEVPAPAAEKPNLEEALAELATVQGDSPLISLEVDPEVVARVVADWTGIPLGKMVRDESSTLLNFEERLGERIKGQQQVLQAVARGIRASKAGLKSPNTPIGVFLLVGPSGVGKTECGLAVADLLFGGERFMVTINMSEFQEKHTVSRLIGSPPGYVGYGEGGVLTEAVRQRPYSLVLLDEVEKADPEVLNLFYQVFDKGMLSDGEGRVIDFKNTVLFLTSNLGSEILTELCSGAELPEEKVVADAIRPALIHHFKPALLGRMTVVPFYPIREEAMKEIVVLKLGHLAKRLAESHRMELFYAPTLVENIAQRCTEVETGARNIDHILSGTLLPRIAAELLQRMSEGPLPDVLEIGLSEGGEFTLGFREKARE